MAKRKARARRRPVAGRKRSAAGRSRAGSRTAAARAKAARKRPAARSASKSKPAAKAKAKTRSTRRVVGRRAAKRALKKAAKLVRKSARPKGAPKKIKLVRVAKVAKTAKSGVAKATPPAVAKPVSTPVRRATVVKPSAAAAGGGKKKHALGLDRERRMIQGDDVVSPMPPSSLNLDRTASAARTGRQELREKFAKHTETSPALTGGDVDADWESAYSVGDEAPGGDNPTPDQNNVDDIGVALGVEYADNEELEGAEKIEERDRHRWEDDPASSDDFDER